MRRIVWTLALGVTALVVASCSRTPSEPPKPAVPQTQTEAPAPSGGGTGSRVVGAVGKALVKSFASGPEEKTEPAPKFKP